MKLVQENHNNKKYSIKEILVRY